MPASKKPRRKYVPKYGTQDTITTLFDGDKPLQGELRDVTRDEETAERNACDEWWHSQPNKSASIQEAWVERARRAKEAEHQLLVRAADIAFDHLFTVHNAVEARALSKAIMDLMEKQR